MKLLLALVVSLYAAVGIAAPNPVNITVGSSALTFQPDSAWATLTIDNEGTPGCPTSAFTEFRTTSTVGAFMTAKFIGTAVSLMSVVDDDRGMISVVLDGEAPTSVNATAGPGATERGCKSLWSRDRLESGSHTLVITVSDAPESTKFEFLALIVTPPDTSTQPPSSSDTSTLPSDTSRSLSDTSSRSLDTISLPSQTSSRSLNTSSPPSGTNSLPLGASSSPSNTNTPVPDPSGVVSPSLIAGVVAAVIVIIAAAIFALFVIWRRRKSQKATIEPLLVMGAPHLDPRSRVPHGGYSNIGNSRVNLAAPTPYTYAVDGSSAMPSFSSPPPSSYPASSGPTSNSAPSDVPRDANRPHELDQLYPPPGARSATGGVIAYSGVERPDAVVGAAAPLSEKARLEADRRRREQQQGQQVTGFTGPPGQRGSREGIEAFMAGALSEQEVNRIAQRLAQIQSGPLPPGAAPPAYQG